MNNHPNHPGRPALPKPLWRSGKRLRAFGALLLAFTASNLLAGELSLPGKDGKAPVPISDDDWHFTIAMPSWVAWSQGTTGLNGFNSSANIGPDFVIPRIDMAGELRAEVSKGKLGLYGDVLYLSLSDSFYTHSILRKADVREDEWLMDYGLRWRLVENEKGYLDAIVGLRYTNLYEKLQLHPNEGAIDDASRTLAVASVAAQAAALTRDLRALHGTTPKIPIPPLANADPSQIARAIEHLRGTVAQRTDHIQRVLNDQMSRRFARDDDWIDPYLGLRGRYNLNAKYYLSGKADLGGFTVGSQISVETSAGIGMQLSPHVFAEVNFRMLYVDYEGGGFLYKTTTFGPEVVLGMNF